MSPSWSSLAHVSVRLKSKFSARGHKRAILYNLNRQESYLRLVVRVFDRCEEARSMLVTNECVYSTFESNVRPFSDYAPGWHEPRTPFVRPFSAAYFVYCIVGRHREKVRKNPVQTYVRARTGPLR